MDKFEEYVAYVGKTKTMDKEQIKKSFEAWLDNPKSGMGVFCVRWVEDETLSNLMPFKEWAGNVTRRL